MVDVVPFFFEDNDHTRGTVPRINTLAAALRDKGGTVARVVPSPGELRPRDVESLGPEIAAMSNANGGEGSVRERLWPELQPVRRARASGLTSAASR